MSVLTTEDIESQVREVTDEEVQLYQEQGWVELRSLVSQDLAAALLSQLRRLSGVEVEELHRDDPESDAIVNRIRDAGVYNLFSMPRMRDQLVWEIASSRALGEASARLTGTRPMRLFNDGVFCKLPSWTERPLALNSRLSGTWAGQTPWHQDFAALPWDRGGAVQFWMALTEITPEMGSMQHLSGSHREPPRGGAHLGEGQTPLEEAFPQLWEKYELSPAHHFLPGDVLAHDSLTIHYAQPNQTDRLRWAYTSYRVPADTLYTGVPYARFDEFGIKFETWKPFDHPKFPIVAE